MAPISPTITTILVATLWATPAYAGPLKSRGEIGIESHAFYPDDDSHTQDYNVAAVARLQLDWRLKPIKLRGRALARYDQTDRPRSAVLPEELWVEFKMHPLRLRAGFLMQTWTATEAFHPADVINSRYFDSSIENPEKLGELAVSLRVKLFNGNIEAFFMPYALDPIQPSPRTRLRFGPPNITLGAPIRLKRNGTIGSSRAAPHWAVRAQQTLGSADISVHVLQHTDRQLPLVVVDRSLRPSPLFQPMTQIGGTYQQALGPVLIKAEAAHRFYVTSKNRRRVWYGKHSRSRSHHNGSGRRIWRSARCRVGIDVLARRPGGLGIS